MKNILLNTEQEKAVNHIEGPLLVLAGAGSGKTRVVTMKIAKLISIGVDPSEILAVTFTNKAANELSTRIRELTSKNIIASTFHSLGARILRESINHLDYSNNFTIYDEEDSLKILKECLSHLQLKEDKSVLKKIRYKIASLKNDLIDVNDTNAMSHLTKNEIEAFRLYQSKLKTCNALDFEDLLYLTAKLLKENKEVLDFYQKRWPFILIDEYQDTNLVQYTIAKILSQKSQNICVVGDPDQSIYSWRGARYQNILNFDSDFKGATIIKLETNYRSTPTILKAANELIKNNSSRFEKNLKSDLEDGEKIKVFKADTEKLEAAFVVEKILKHTKNEKTSLKDITIFYRTNFQSRVFEDILLENQIPYIIYGGLSFYQRKEIKDILAFLRLVILNTDFLAFSRTINIPKRGFGKTTISKLFLVSEKNNIPIIPFLKKLMQDPSSYPEIRLSAKQKVNLDIYLKSLFEIRELYEQSIDLDELISHILTKMKYVDYLKEDPLSFDDRKENIDELITKANQAYKNNQSLVKFLEDIALATTKIENAKDDSLKLMTLHNSKGLEFETVFIVGLEEDLFPHVNSKNSQEEIEEERRLLYVGMTRAKKNLYITHSLSRYMFGGVKLSLPSRFLKELDKECLEDLSTPYQQTYRDFYQSKPTFSKPKIDTDYISSSASYSVGQRVFHKTFGSGSVKKVYQTSLGETLDILFEGSHHMRSLVIKYAKLKIL